MNKLAPPAVTVLFASFAGIALAAGGTVVRTVGPVSLKRGAQEIQVATGMSHSEGGPSESARAQEAIESPGFALLPGDVLKTGVRSNAQLHFEDDSVFSVPGGSALRVDQYRTRTGGQSGQAVFTLLHGGFRTITGTIGKAPGDQYEIRTPFATVRALGTVYAAVVCKGNCGKHKDGLYVKAEQGIIFVANGGGEIKLVAGKIAFVQAEGAAPVRVTVSPFDDPLFAADYSIQLEYDYRVDPPRVEPELPASPS